MFNYLDKVSSIVVSLQVNAVMQDDLLMLIKDESILANSTVMPESIFQS